MKPRATRTVTRGDPATDAGWIDPPERVGFFTDTTLCIGCKACEVACKEWNLVPADGMTFLDSSYDHTGGLGANTWRHVAFVERRNVPEAGASELGAPGTPDVSWLMSSDVCKHCTSAACLDVCPTGSIFRTELGTVVVQPEICNGCGYCVPACPFGVITRREGDGRAWKCTLCYDRLHGDLQPACAQACPTQSIQFGPLADLRERAAARVETLRARGAVDARLYGADPDDGVGGFGAFFLLLDDPAVYGLPRNPVVTTRDLPSMWRAAAVAGVAMVGAAVAAFAGRRR